MATYYGKLKLALKLNGGRYNGSTSDITVNSATLSRSGKGSTNATISLSSYYPSGITRTGYKLVGFNVSSTARTATYTASYSATINCNSTSSSSPTITTASVYAIWQTATTSGTYRNVPWEIDTDTNILYIGQVGQTYTYSNASTQAIIDWPWNWMASSITEVHFLGTVNGNANMSSMFYGMRNATTIDLTNFYTSAVTDMLSMFYNCSSLTSLDVSGFDLSNAESITSMFRGCSGLTSLNLSGFDTSNVTSMHQLFHSCSSLVSLDISGFDTSSITNVNGFSYMFYNCSSLTSLDVSNFDASAIQNMSYMFGGCSGLTSLDVSGFSTPSAKNITSMFNGCSSLTQLDLSKFDLSSVTSMTSLFNGCSSLTTIYVSDLWSVPSSIQSYTIIFTDCVSLVGGAGTTFNSTYNKVDYAHIDGGASNPGYFTLKPSVAFTALLKVAGTWQNGEFSIKINGTWEAVTAGFVKVNGAWEQLT